MSATYYERDGDGIGGLGLMFLLTLVGLGILMVVFTDHSQTSHAGQVPAIDNCFSGGGVVSGWFQMPGGRYARHCQQDGRGYWRISECVGDVRMVVTQFQQKLAGFSRYMTNKQMQPAAPPPCR